MSIWGKILGSDKVIDSGISAIDKMVYTDEEKSDKKALFLQLYEPFKVAQRYLSLIYCIPYSLAWFITFVASLFSNVDSQLSILQGDFGTICIIIVTFYFGGGAVEGVVNRFSKSK